MLRLHSKNDLSSARTRPVPLRMRHDLVIQRRAAGSSIRFVIKDPISQTHHQLWEHEFALLRLLDGQRSPQQIKDQFEMDFQPARLDLNRLESLHASFYRNGLAVSLRPGQAEPLWRQKVQAKRIRIPRLIMSLLSFRVRGLNPNRLFEQVNHWLGWLQHPAMLLASLVLIVITVLSLIANGPAVMARLPQLHEYLTVNNFFLLVISLISLKLIHELAHGLACKQSGGECNELGIMFLLLAPCLYCDVSDAWLIENKWRRAWVAAAGLWSELTIAAGCTWLWWFTYPGLVNTLCLNIMLLGGLTSLIFNANPLLRYDGYFVLSDLTEIPNLWERSRASLRSAWVRFFYRSSHSRTDELPDQPGIGLVAYAIGSILYQWTVVVLVLMLLYKSLEALRLEALGALLTAMLVIVMMVVPAAQQTMRMLSNPRRLGALRPGRTLGALGLLGIVVVLFCFLPLPCSVRAPYVLSPAGIQLIVAPVEGILQACVPEGSRVTAGQTIAQLYSASMTLELASKEGEWNRQRIHLQGLEARRATDPIVPAQITTTQQAIRGLEAEVAGLRSVLQQMTIRSPIDGIIVAAQRRPVRERFSGLKLTLNERDSIDQESNETWTGSPIDRENGGCLLTAGQAICHVAPPSKLEGHVLLSQSQIDWIAVGQPVTARTAIAPSARLLGNVIEISALPTRELPTIVAHQQLIAHRPTAAGQFEALNPVYRVRVEFEAPGMTQSLHEKLPRIDQAVGQATISVAPRSLGARVWRLVCESLGLPAV